MKQFLNIILLLTIVIGYSQNNVTKYAVLSKKLNQTSDPKEKIHLYYDLSQEVEHTDIKKSEKFSKKLLQESKKLNYKRGIGLYYNTQASIAFKLSDNEKGLIAANLAEKIFNTEKDTLFYLKNVRTKARILGNLKRKKEKFSCLTKAYKIAIKTKYYVEIADISYLLADDFVYDDVAKSFNYLNIAAKYFELGKDEIGLAGCYYLLASTYYDTGEYDKAEVYIKKSFEIVKKFKNRQIFQVYCLRIFTKIYSKQKKNKKAIQSATSTIDLNLKYGYKFFIPIDYETIAEIYLIQKNYSQAIVYLKKALNSQPDLETKFSVFKNLGKVYYETRKYEIAKNYQITAIKILDSTKYKTEREVFKELSKTLTSLNNYKEANVNLQKYSDLNTAFLTEEKKSKIHELQIKFELSDKENEIGKIKTIEKQNLIKYEYERRKNYLLVIAITSIIGLCFTLIVFYLQIKKKNSLLNQQNTIIEINNKELSESNRIINNLLVIKETLLKEVHHRVKNNLQLVMSLLNIQAQDAQNVSIDDFLIKGRSRIATIALIHQNLYENTSLAKIDFQNYLENLLENIINTFNNNNVQFKIQTNNLTFDIDTAIPLGLIINELVCNSLKHAFPKKGFGMIVIELNKIESNQYNLKIGDNGVGSTTTIKNSNSIGLEIVSLLVKQLNGKIQLLNSPGTNYKITFKEINQG
jgi:two-component sensor histidine kinase